MAIRRLIIWRGSRVFPSSIEEALTGEEYNLVAVDSLEQILDHLDQKPPYAVLVDASASENETRERVTQLASTEKLFGVPLIVLSGPRSEGLSLLERQFDSFASLSVPCDTEELIVLLEEAPERAAKKTKSFKRPGSESSVEQSPLLRNLDPKKLVSSYGGLVFASAHKRSNFDDALLIPEHPAKEQIEKGLEEITESSRILGLNSRRVCYLALSLSGTVGDSIKNDSSLRVAALLLNWGFVGDLSYLTDKELIGDDIGHYADQMSAALDRSADLIKERTHDSEATLIMSSVSKRVNREETMDQTHIDMAAQCLLVSEIATRACWKRNGWSVNGVHRLIRDLQRGTYYSFDSKIADTMCRILSEASSIRHAEAPSDSASKLMSADQNAELIKQAALEAKKLFGDEPTLDLDLSDLKKGHRLARPILTDDGRLILPSNVVLDDSLIFGIWRLAALWPITKKISVVK
jgi:hypothetical protein